MQLTNGQSPGKRLFVRALTDTRESDSRSDASTTVRHMPLPNIPVRSRDSAFRPWHSLRSER
ncbi:hypothetical protein GCM10010236_10850 [Streptomyces eurythermus]|nr:hypothetical protein GCM10010236_10850 [Streptomyces eurythermus]